MGTQLPASVLETARNHLGLSMEQLWTGYMALRGQPVALPPRGLPGRHRPAR
jgi:hypothetical protein